MMSIAASVEYIKIIAVLKSTHLWVLGGFLKLVCGGKTISSAILCKSEVRILAHSRLDV
jgi:hypothetical protein